MPTVKWRIWLENERGEPFFGDGRAGLLEAIEQTGSLVEAAKRTQMAYRTAWRHLNAMEKGLGRRLVERRAGGKRGGGCRLTPRGKEFLRNYLKFRKGLDEMRDRRFARHFGGG